MECVCNEGFKLIGQSIVTCGKNGDWDYEIPTCVQGRDNKDFSFNNKMNSRFLKYVNITKF